MKREIALVFAVALTLAPPAARAAGYPYVVTIDGRAMTPKASNSTGAMWSAGVIYIDAVVATKVFDGLLTQRNHGKTMTLTIRRHDGTFTLGSLYALIDGKRLRLPGAPFRYEGDIFVPLSALAKLAHARLTIDAKGHTAALTSQSSTVSAPRALVTPLPSGSAEPMVVPGSAAPHPATT